jgi:hypothetical protein
MVTGLVAALIVVASIAGMGMAKRSHANDHRAHERNSGRAAGLRWGRRDVIFHNQASTIQLGSSLSTNSHVTLTTTTLTSTLNKIVITAYDNATIETMVNGTEIVCTTINSHYDLPSHYWAARR